jgi:hypothetical protein
MRALPPAVAGEATAASAPTRAKESIMSIRPPSVRSPSPLRLVLLPALLGAGCYIYTADPPDDPGYGSSPADPAPPAPPARPPSEPPARPPSPPAPPGRGSTPPGDPLCPGPTVDRWKELLIIEPSVVGDRRAASDQPDAPWSFRRHLQDLAGRDAAGDLAWTWLSQWRWGYTVTTAPGVPDAARAAVTPRPSVDDQLICPWLRLTPANGCTPTCTTCNDRRLDLARAPFRLIALVNRADLGEAAGPCSRDGGELRFIYTAVAPGSLTPLPFTVIFEYRVALPAGQDRRAWAAAWRELGRISFGPDFNARLDSVIAQGMRGASLQRVRTNEVALGQPLGLPWELRQFVPVAGARGGVSLEATAPSQTPRLSLDGTPELAAWLRDNRLAILDGDNRLPPDLLAGSALLERPDFRWQAPGADPEVLDAFNSHTCNGCHGGRGDTADLPFSHVAAAAGASYQDGPSPPARVSRYLHDPRGGDDELGRRARLLEAAACVSCGASYP